MKCDFCGCTDNSACPGGCRWVVPGICSQCERIIDAVCTHCGHLFATNRNTNVFSVDELACPICGSINVEEYRDPEQVKEIFEQAEEELETERQQLQDELATIEEPVSVGELTRVTGLPRDTVEMHLHTLEDAGEAEVAETRGQVDLWVKA